ncbi:MAG TPA: protein phosphatase 2C domain-containing protein [Negativicutes bacterium]|nr:protein phosphatase 2C domain-containing protein [Negativicutes bacterium]
MIIEAAALSKAGGRKGNQDSFGSERNDNGGCWVVADGLGGHAGGETASRMAVEYVLAHFRNAAEISGEFIADCFRQVQVAIQQKGVEDLGLSGMRTTLVVLACDHENAVWGHVGDSRLYWFRQGKILQQTHDHSVPQMLVDAGKISPQEIRGHEDQNRLTRAVGQDGELRPTIVPKLFSIEEGDSVLLCSDGVWTYVLEQEMEADLLVANSADEWLNLMEKRVLARAEGPYDNYTAVAVWFQGAMKK